MIISGCVTVFGTFCLDEFISELLHSHNAKINTYDKFDETEDFYLMHLAISYIYIMAINSKLVNIKTF